MELEYHFSHIPELKNLSIMVDNNGGRLRAKLQGRYSLLTWFLIQFYFIFHDKIGSLATYQGSNVPSMYLTPIPSQAHVRMLESFLTSTLFKRPVPMAATIAVTDKCQCRCIHCSAEGRPKNIPILTTEELKKVVQQCIDLGITNLTFTGGEPLLRLDLEEVITSIPPSQAITLVFTNSLGLTAKRAKSLKEAGLFGVHISLDSADPSEHDYLRGVKGTFQAVEEGVKNALNNHLIVGISTYITKDRALNHTLSSIANLCAQWGVHEISVFDAIQTGNFLEEKTIALDKKARRVLLKESKKINKKFKGRPRIITQTWTNSGKGFSRFIGCLAANWQFHITSQGEFTPCDFTPLSFGNVREEPITSLWQKILQHPAYNHHHQSCRMQDAEFRSRYIETIPQDADLPYSIFKLDKS